MKNEDQDILIYGKHIHNRKQAGGFSVDMSYEYYVALGKRYKL